MKRILVIGRGGQLSRELQLLSNDIRGLEYHFYETPDPDAARVWRFVKEYQIDMLINCSDYMLMDEAEEDPDLADRLLADFPELLAHMAVDAGFFLIHLSSSQVFGGSGVYPYKPDDACAPLNVYGDAALRGEMAIQSVNPPHVILRTSWVYSAYGDNFIKQTLRAFSSGMPVLAIADQIGNPTHARDVAETIIRIIINRSQCPDSRIVYHFSNEGVASWYDLAMAVREYTGGRGQVIPQLAGVSGTKNSNPVCQMLDNSLIKKELSLDIPHWRESLRRCLHQLSGR